MDAALRLRRIGLAACLLATAWATPARADEATAEKRFQDGSAAFARRDYRAAALAFEGAFEQAPSGAAMYNAAQAWALVGDGARTADAFEAAVTAGGLEATQLKTATARLVELRRA